MKLYDRATSGNCHKIRLFAGLTGIELTLIPVNTEAGEQKTAAFAALNPFQHVPVLRDASIVIWETPAILIYLARKFDLTHWWPEEAESQAHIAAWLSISTNELWHGPARARAIVKRGGPGDLAAAHAIAADLLPRLDRHLDGREWFATSRPSIADCALFPYLAMAPEGRIDLAPFPHLRAWLNRVIALPGFLGMDGILDHY
ncbi:glutathione S-transferase family protein [Acidomonas methanolica]|uniref:glutathione S-transferase family protein n=1 Tax=Acidomonas methanolica TaxID=437 RepID=UPI00211A3A79|nr:glutathione binding-like protein [Acidomonas methanolica]MCQ9155542.1 glutathione S-transferase N-terminal domain-containing protein [Acidomonas methanolica]